MDFSVNTKTDAQRVFDVLASTLHAVYDVKFDQRGSRDLVIVFSPHSRQDLKTYPFEQDVLFISDRKLFYYTFNPGTQVAKLHQFLIDAGYERAVFVGASKGGTGAVLWSGLLQRRKPNLKITTLAFSPQLKLYPFNSNLESLPSYVSNIRLMNEKVANRTNFINYGDVPEVIRASTPKTTIVYGSRYSMDEKEAMRLADNPSVTLYPIDVSFHGSITPFVTDTSDPAAVRRLAEKLYADAKKDADLKASLPPTVSELVQDLQRVNCPTLVQMIERSLSSGEVEVSAEAVD